MWIWIIIFLPIVGCIAYIFMEMISGRDLQRIDLGNFFSTKPSVKKLEENLHFSDTFNNRVALADAYLANDEKDKAIDLYESSLTGAFEENEYVRSQLIIAYSETKQYDKVVVLSKKIYRLLTFPRSRAHMLYAMALEQLGNISAAEKEFQKMQTRFSFYEPRYQYGLFLIRTNRPEEARQLFHSILEEYVHLSPRERRSASPYVKLIKEELKTLSEKAEI